MKVEKVSKDILTAFKSEEPTIQQLRNVAKNLGLNLKRNMKKNDILKLVIQEIRKLEKSVNEYIDNKSKGTAIISTVSKKEKESKKTKKDRVVTLPETYNKDVCRLMLVNPKWTYAYWDFSEKTKNDIKKYSKNKIYIRLIKIDREDKIQSKETVFFDTADLENTKSYYFNVPKDDSNYVVQLEIESKKGVFKPILESNELKIPPLSQKEPQEERWFFVKKHEIVVEKLTSKPSTYEEISQMYKKKFDEIGKNLNPLILSGGFLK
ncbi:DUF4912 domain-containing protein [Petrotoga sp. 9PWA.NaAc.5.4]|uniref:DUF4912 domain-containing protein n=1 Tax=Petrotoga sp. 9PWA.NaAc.5.4 TaxID=1434328 RepID=UPI000CBAD2DC|nr:DUF4912 domain-containing protein [Petrotoga sp. 9PWA.NaAc.5.4]PNR94673.1 hypothetical protein X924_06220 [Petrotoga sp. 9PWA.NaAc.5.4]